MAMPISIDFTDLEETLQRDPYKQQIFSTLQHNPQAHYDF